MNKLIESMATPIMWVFVLMVSGLILGLRQRRKRLCFVGRILIIAAGLVLYLFSIPAISDRLLCSLECQYRQPDIEVLSSLDLVVVLGAGYHPSGGFRESAEPSGLVYARVLGGVKAFKNSGAGVLALCGGGDDETDETESDVMKTLAMVLGVREDRIITEVRSQNTMENATELKRLLDTNGQRHIGLATSALHMPPFQRFSPPCRMHVETGLSCGHDRAYSSGISLYTSETISGEYDPFLGSLADEHRSNPRMGWHALVHDPI